MLLPLLEGTDIFLTRLHIMPTNNIKIFIDADNGLSIAKSASINRSLYREIESSALYPDGDFSLEVSSPGVDEPLVSNRQYKKNIGRTLEVTTVDSEHFLGQMTDVSDNCITIHLKGTKKEAPRDVEIQFEKIKTAIVQIIF